MGRQRRPRVLLGHRGQRGNVSSTGTDGNGNGNGNPTYDGGIGAQADAASYGVFASSRGGTGGTGGEAAHGIVSNSGDGGPGAGAYDVTVSVASGAGVITSGQNAAAIVAQSLSGSGGAGGEVFAGIARMATLTILQAIGLFARRNADKDVPMPHCKADRPTTASRPRRSRRP